MPPSDHDIREIHLSLERQYAKIQSILTRLTALESRCNCSAASSAGAGPGSSATEGSISSAPTTTSASSASSGSSDPVSAAIHNSTVYGWCPHCGAAGWNRERRPNGYDLCVNGHRYPSSTAVYSPKPEAKPHAETAEEVAWRTARDVLDTVFNCNGQGYGNMLDKLTPIITAAIKRERGEA